MVGPAMTTTARPFRRQCRLRPAGTRRSWPPFRPAFLGGFRSRR